MNFLWFCNSGLGIGQNYGQTRIQTGFGHPEFRISVSGRNRFQTGFFKNETRVIGFKTGNKANLKNSLVYKNKYLLNEFNRKIAYLYLFSKSQGSFLYKHYIILYKNLAGY